MYTRREKLIYWIMGLGTGIVVSGMIMLGLALKLVMPVETARSEIQAEVVSEPVVKEIPLTTSITTPADLVVVEEVSREDAGTIKVTIPNYYAADAIAALLAEKGVVEDEEAFLAYIKKEKKTRFLQHGVLFFPKNGQYSDVLDILLTRGQ